MANTQTFGQTEGRKKEGARRIGVTEKAEEIWAEEEAEKKAVPTSLAGSAVVGEWGIN